MELSEHLEPDLFGPQLFWKGEGGANGFYKCSSLQFSPRESAVNSPVLKWRGMTS